MNTPAAIWLDMQLPPGMCGGLAAQSGLPCEHLVSRAMDRTPDEEVFRAAREANTVILTKDSDFARLLQQNGPPPFSVWLRCGNCSVATLRELLDRFLPHALELIRSGEPLVEIVSLPPDPSQPR